MGMYTEIYVSTDLAENTPEDVVAVLRAITEKDMHSPALVGKPARWFMLFNSGSYYTPDTECAALTFDDNGEQWSLIGKGDIKNYNGEIEAFFEFIAPYARSGFIGYFRYEEELVPTLVFVKLEGGLAICTPTEDTIQDVSF